MDASRNSNFVTSKNAAIVCITSSINSAKIDITVCPVTLDGEIEYRI